MRRLMGAVAGLALALAASSAAAGGWYGHHHGWHGHYGYGASYHKHGYRHHRGRRGDSAAYLVGGLIGGIIIGSLLTQSSHAAPPRTVVYQPATPVFTHCLPTTGTDWHQGRQALYRGTMCYDPQGRSYILSNSVRFVGYVR